MVDFTPGFLILHGNRQEDLRDILVDWLRRHPLPPLEKETLIVQSNGVAQWLQLALASDEGLGIAAAIELHLPGRFLWQAYRAVLGPQLPTKTVFDKSALIWRIYRMLPHCREQAVYKPLEQYLTNDYQARKRYQLALRLADLFDQYQVYRADWLLAWEQEHDVIGFVDAPMPLPAGQIWQAQLWRDLCAQLPENDRLLSRPHVHQRFLQAAKNLTADKRPAALPRRIVVFGLSSLPAQTIEVLQALSSCCQIFLTVNNPSQYFWADIKDQREQWRLAKKSRHPERQMTGENYGHPLLAAWGKQGRDFIDMLQQSDQSERFIDTVYQQKIDVFNEPEGQHVLAYLQNDILELRSLDEAQALQRVVDHTDNSCVFHICHSAQREVEVLHDQLLQAFNDDPTLSPRDVLVMAPDINHYAPHIQAVFGQVDKNDTRYLSFVISDQGARQNNPLLAGLEYLLQINEARCTSSEIVDLLAIPALRQKFAIHEDDLPQLQRWITESGIRWGLDAAHREALALPALPENTWLFGLERMLLGYATGADLAWQGVEAYDEIAGLDAILAGKLIYFVHELNRYRSILAQTYSVDEWQHVLQQLQADFFVMQTPNELRLALQLQSSLEQWVEACAIAHCQETLPVAVVISHWLPMLDQHHLSQRFFAGSINFASLMPMRAIPFRKVCLLGMSDSAYPRRQQANDFDLMRYQYRPGDRSRREDDRYLFLEALLSAREQLYISWTGRSVQDNSERAASVLVNQLRDHLAAVFGEKVLQQLTIEHPLQPFSEQYFSQSGQQQGFYTYAHEWQNLHQQPSALNQQEKALPLRVLEQGLNLRQWLAAFENPTKFFFNERLKVYLERYSEEELGTETFALDGLDYWQLQQTVLDRLLKTIEDAPSADFNTELDKAVNQLQGRGVLALAGFAEQQKNALRSNLLPLLTSYQAWIRECQAEKSRTIVLEASTLALSLTVFRAAVFEDSIGSLYRRDGKLFYLSVTQSKLIKDKEPVYGHFRQAWLVRALLAASGEVAYCVMISPDTVLQLPMLSQQEAQLQLASIATLIEQALQQPVPASLPLMMQKLSGKKEWQEQFDKLDDKKWVYLKRAFQRVDELELLADDERYLALYRHFKNDIDTLMKGEQHG